VTWVRWKLVSFRLETVFVSIQDWCTVCAKHTIGFYSVLLDIVVILVQDRCTVCAEHTTGSEIVFDAPDGTPR
jgi:hypothetical protein